MYRHQQSNGWWVIVFFFHESLIKLHHIISQSAERSVFMFIGAGSCEWNYNVAECEISHLRWEKQAFPFPFLCSFLQKLKEMNHDRWSDVNEPMHREQNDATAAQGFLSGSRSKPASTRLHKASDLHVLAPSLALICISHKWPQQTWIINHKCYWPCGLRCSSC